MVSSVFGLRIIVNRQPPSGEGRPISDPDVTHLSKRVVYVRVFRSEEAQGSLCLPPLHKKATQRGRLEESLRLGLASFL
jgi:hypothetical protein